MIMRFITDVLGLPRQSIKPYFALEPLMATAHEMSMSPTDLDHGGLAMAASTLRI